MIYIYGTGGLAREVANLLHENGEYSRLGGFVDLPEVVAKFEGQLLLDRPVISESEVTSKEDARIVVGVATPHIRRKIVESLPADTKYESVIHHSAFVGMGVSLGPGAVVGAYCVLTTNILIGAHATLDISTVVGHDCEIGDYFTTARGVNVSGSCTIADEVYLGTGSAIRQGHWVERGVTVGMGAMVVKDCGQAGGVYVGVPARLLRIAAGSAA